MLINVNYLNKKNINELIKVLKEVHINHKLINNTLPLKLLISWVK